MNMWTAKGKRITTEDLLGADFMQDIREPKFKSKEAWEAHKAELQKMARWHSHILREMKAGKRKVKKDVTIEMMQSDKRGH